MVLGLRPRFLLNLVGFIEILTSPLAICPSILDWIIVDCSSFDTEPSNGRWMFSTLYDTETESFGFWRSVIRLVPNGVSLLERSAKLGY